MGTVMAFSSSHTYALVLSKEMGDVSDVITWRITNTFRESSQGLQMEYMRIQHSYTMALVALLTLCTGRCEQLMFFASIISMNSKSLLESKVLSMYTSNCCWLSHHSAFLVSTMSCMWDSIMAPQFMLCLN